MRIGVSIDGVLRDFLNRVEEVYEKYFLKDEDSEIKIPDYNLEKWLDFPEEEVKQAEMVFNPEFDEDSFLDSEEEASKLENKIEDLIGRKVSFYLASKFIKDKEHIVLFNSKDK